MTVDHVARGRGPEDRADRCAVELVLVVMEVVDRPGVFAPITDEFRKVVAALAGEKFSNIVGLKRFTFYERAHQAYAVIATGERRLYGNIILQKGLIEP